MFKKLLFCLTALLSLIFYMSHRMNKTSTSTLLKFFVEAHANFMYVLMAGIVSMRVDSSVAERVDWNFCLDDALYRVDTAMF